jgi:hypothetical protein
MYEGPEGCKFFNADISGFTKFLFKFVGIIEIGAGILMAYYGARMIEYVFMILVFILSFVLVIVFSYSAHLFSLDGKNMALSIVMTIVACVVGFLISKHTLKFTEEWASTLISAFCLGIASFMLIFPIKEIPVPAKYTIVILSVGAAGYIGKKFDKYIRAYGTALIGAFLLVHGISQYVGGFPATIFKSTVVSEGQSISLDTEVFSKGKVIGYIVGMIVIAASGSFV